MRHKAWEATKAGTIQKVQDARDPWQILLGHTGMVVLLRKPELLFATSVMEYDH